MRTMNNEAHSAMRTHSNMHIAIIRRIAIIRKIASLSLPMHWLSILANLAIVFSNHLLDKVT
jgi:hypothetical protein